MLNKLFEVIIILNTEGKIQTLNSVNVHDDNDLHAAIVINGTKMQSTPELDEYAQKVIIQGKICESLNCKIEQAVFYYGTDVEIIKLEKCKKVHFTAAYVEGKMTGICSGQILGKISSSANAISNALKYKLGFHKSSLSVIQNVLSARNYEYQWVYSHHKVVYYSNYLIVEILKQCLQNYNSNENEALETFRHILNWKTMVDLSHGGEISCIPLGQSELKFYRPTDFDILFLFKTTFLNSRLESPIHSLLNEFYIRQFKTSLWKSYAEYKIFFSSFTAEEIRKVIEIIKKDSYKGITQNYGTINDPTLERRFALLGMKNVVWVDGRSKLKKLNPQNTFILFKDCVRTYQSISTQNELLEDQQSLDVIYLYYNLVDGKKIEKPLVKKMFKELISDIPG